MTCRARLGLPAFDGLTIDHAAAAAALIFGWDGDGPARVSIPPRTVEGFDAACTRVLEVARGGGRLAFATARPASLLGLHRALAAEASTAGGTVLSATQSAPVDRGGHRIWWIDGVATVTDGESLLADDSRHRAPRSGCSCCRSPTSSSPTTGSPGIAAAVGLEVVAFADLDAMALASPSWRGLRGPGRPPRRARRPPGLRAAPRAARRSGRGARRQRLTRRTGADSVHRPATMRPFDPLLQHGAHPPTLPTAESGTGWKG